MIASGAVQKRSTFKAYGDEVQNSGTHKEEKGFIRERSDAETGLLYLNARYYDPAIDRLVRAGVSFRPNRISFLTSMGLAPPTNSSEFSLDIFINASGRRSGTPILVTDTRADWVIPVPRILVRLSAV